MNSSLLPVLPLRDIVVFPGMVAPLFVGRKQSVNALNNSGSRISSLTNCEFLSAIKFSPAVILLPVCVKGGIKNRFK